MASVTVFVDDVVQGDLPAICARDGVPTGDSLRRSHEVGSRSGLGIAWLLLLAGPLGWLGLLLIAVSKSGRGEHLRVQLPLSEAAYQRLRQARRLRDRSVLALVVGAVLGLVLLSADGSGPLSQLALLTAGGVSITALVLMIAGSIRHERESVGVSLDASRRWVTLSNVHATFSAACEARSASHPRRA